MKSPQATRIVAAFLVLPLLLAWLPAAEPAPDLFRVAATNAEQAARALEAADRTQRAWAAHADPRTGLLPQNLRSPLWTPCNSAADLYPFFVLTSYFTDPESYRGRWRKVLETEALLTSRLGALPDDYSLECGGFVHPSPDLGRIIFGSSEYMKDGLIPIADVLGYTPWFARLRDIADALMERFPVETRYGRIPSESAEVNGNVLQSFSRLYWATADRRYLDACERILRAYFEEVMPACGGIPVHLWDFTAHRAVTDTLNINDHGNEIIGGLVECYLSLSEARPDAAAPLRPTFVAMVDRLLEIGRNPDGLWVNLIRPKTGEVLDPSTPDTWGYGLTAVYQAYLLTGEERYREAVRKALTSLKNPKYLTWAGGADSYADSIEGGIILVNREPMPEAIEWLDKVFSIFLAFQQPDGVVEGWHGDGNFARTALLYAFMKTRGLHVEPWRPDIRLGATVEGGRLWIHLSASEAWSGVLRFDRARWREYLHLPRNYPRLNEYPVWFDAQASRVYRVGGTGMGLRATGLELRDGLPLRLDAGGKLELIIEPEAVRTVERSVPEIGPDGVYMEAEDFSGTWREQTNYGGYSGSGFRVSNAQGVATSVLSRTVQVKASAEYTVWARGLVSPDQDRSFSVEVGGTRFASTHRNSEATAFRWDGCGSVKLHPGEVEVVIHDEGPGYECPDVLFLTADAGASPEQPGREPAVPPEFSREALSRANLERLIALHDEDDGRRRAAVANAEDWNSRRSMLQREVKRTLGLEPEPPRTPLSARTVEVIERDGYVIEKVVFDSRPGMPVPANLYLPRGDGAPAPPWPAVLCPVGHWGLSKTEPVVQARCVGLAKLGFAVLVYDPVGQGERAVEGNEHTHACIALLVGESNMSYMIWDSVRAVDYLEGRKEVDLSRLGCTGCSGGGLNTMYLTAVEPRLKAAAPVCYVCTFASFFKTGITHCPCSHVPGMARLTDMDEVSGLFAPRGLLVVGGVKDPMFTEAGMREAFTGIRRLYEFAGSPRAPELFFDDCAHDYSQTMRERMYGFFLRELAGKGSGEAVPEPMKGTSWQAEKPETLFCFPGGRVPVSSMTYRRSVLDRIRSSSGKEPAAVLEFLRAVVKRPEAPWAWTRGPTFGGAVLGLGVDEEGFRHRALTVSSRKGGGPSDAMPFVIVLDDSGLTSDTPRLLERFCNEGAVGAIAVEPPLWSETGDERHLVFTNGILTGRPPAVLWARTLISHVNREHGNTILVARGPAASITALVVFLTEPSLKVLLAIGAPASWLDLVRPGTDRQGAMLPGAGLCGDVPDLLRAAAPRLVLWTGSSLRARLPLSVEVHGEPLDAVTWIRGAVGK